MDIDGLATGLRLERDADVTDDANGDVDVRCGVGKMAGGDEHTVRAREQAVHPKLTLAVGRCDAANGGADGPENDASSDDASVCGVLNLAAQSTIRILGAQETGKHKEHQQESRQQEDAAGKENGCAHSMQGKPDNHKDPTTTKNELPQFKTAGGMDCALEQGVVSTLAQRINDYKRSSYPFVILWLPKAIRRCRCHQPPRQCLCLRGPMS